MDEVLFRSFQKLENLQVKLNLTASQSKDVLREYSQQGKSAILQAWNSSYSEQIKEKVQAFWHYVVNLGLKAKELVWLHVDVEKLYYNLAKVFWQKWTKRDVCFLCAGFICGSVVGVVFAISRKKKQPLVRYMQAVQCTNYLGIEVRVQDVSQNVPV